MKAADDILQSSLDDSGVISFAGYRDVINEHPGIERIFGSMLHPTKQSAEMHVHQLHHRVSDNIPLIPTIPPISAVAQKST